MSQVQPTDGNPAPEQGQTAEPIFVARQPIFTTDRRIWGYELFFRHSGAAATALIADQDVATARVIADGYALAQAQSTAGKFMLINFPQNLILSGAAFALPRQQCIPEILEHVEPTEDILAACRRLKDSGYTLALDDYVGQDGYEELMRLVDIVKVDVLGMTSAALQALAAGLKRFDARLLAEKIETKEMFEDCVKAGFDLFQGFYFSRPEVVTGTKVSSAQQVKAQLLSMLGKDFEVRELSDAISCDVSLTYRLLKYINAAGFGLRQQVKSVGQAITLLGQNPVRQWLTVVLVADLNPSPAAQEITFLSVLRGRFLEQLAGLMRPAPALSQGSMFLLGLLSRLDVLMNLPMLEIMAQIPLEPGIRGAFLGEATQEREWLDCLLALEEGRFDDAQAILQARSIDMETAAMERLSATEWTRNILGLGG
ncbi:diguanylate phosphodiesterase metal dependent hydrolase domain containing protein [Desulfovibrio sp. X2]|uniref:EAL and HDOD domain-containing protein n=1 Tax=Desulfovibrio sp. X2 TaxID=941449 RepID=UPI000358AE6B|nr:EAL domain-containing protein [Desulfovibrio sp. X2]EPR38676.1 diguanylate phosphodiesterase metal dependent hydrolase domain containing protein [Desulfovibrio sp. X2]